MNADKSRMILVALGIPLLAVILLPLLFMGVMMGVELTRFGGQSYQAAAAWRW